MAEHLQIHLHITDPRTGMQDIATDECWRLLAQHQRSVGVGRLAVVDGHRPIIVPVNYALLERGVVFRTAPGTKLAAAIANDHVAFQIDHVDPDAHTGWSVLIQGRASVVSGSTETFALRALGLAPFSVGEKDTWVLIDAQDISGRRLPMASGFFW